MARKLRGEIRLALPGEVRAAWLFVVLIAISNLLGCAGSRQQLETPAVLEPPIIGQAGPASQTALVSDTGQDAEASRNAGAARPEPIPPLEPPPLAQLAELEAMAQAMNPRLLQLRQQAAAAAARTYYVDQLPDPTVGANIFAHPIETAAGSQRANLTAGQMIPWLSRLDAQSRQACFEALAAQERYEAERLKVVGDVRTLWSRLFVLGKQIAINRANAQILEPLVEVATARLETGGGSARDAWLGQLEQGKLAEQLLALQQQVASTKAELNRAIGRDTDYPIAVPDSLNPTLPDWTHGMLRQIAWERQPEIAAAELASQAASWGIEVARLKRRPDFSLSASWYAIDDNRPTSNLVEVSRDAWSIGAQISIPLWRRKYDALTEEAVWKHAASHASVDEVLQRYDALLRDLWERAQTASETAELYQGRLLPEAKQALDADIDAFSNGQVDLDSIVRDFRSVLLLEVGYHRAVGELAMALARIQQAVGTDLASGQSEAWPASLPDEP